MKILNILNILKYFFLTLLFSLLFQSCSLKTPENKWQYNSASAFSSFTNNFLSNNNDIAKEDLNNAIKYAKQSANLEQLASIYLGACALNISVGDKDECKEYQEIQSLVPSLPLKSYFFMLQNTLQEKDIKYLPLQYQEASKYNFLKEYDLVFESIKNIEQVSSKFIIASLIKNEMKEDEVIYLIKEASFYGYKKLVLFYLDYLLSLEDDKIKKEEIEKKIYILKN